MAKRKGLGRGLGALIPDKNEEKDNFIENKNTETTEEKVNKNTESSRVESATSDTETTPVQDQVVMINIDEIKANQANPRKQFDEENIKSLAESIKLYGILQPLVVTKNDNGYDLVAGERRLRAAKSIDLKHIPVIIKELSRKDQDMISMVENIQREDLNPYEEAQAYYNIMKQYGLTQNELSDVLGKSRTYIANIVRLLALDDFTIRELENGNITSSQGRALLGIKDIFQRKQYLEMLIKKEITVNEIEKRSTRNKKKIPLKKDVFVRDIEDRLKESLGTKVNVKKAKNKWTVNIEFTSDEQIEDFLNHYNIGE